ncbi:MAG: hypothetical protein ACRDJY_03695, partial [Thermoleophilaceae bacterium]
MSLFCNAGRFGTALVAAVALAIPAAALGHGVDHTSPGTDHSPYTIGGKGKYRTHAYEDSASFSAQH